MDLAIESVTDFERVRAIASALDENSRTINDLGRRREELRTKIPAQERRVAALEADVEVGDAEPEEHEDAKDQLESMREELEHVEHRLDTLGKVRDRLEGKKNQAVEEAGVEVQEQLMDAASDAMDALIDALDDAEQARQRLREINDFARHEPDSVEVPAAASKVGKGLALVGHSNRVERSHNKLKQTYGNDE